LAEETGAAFPNLKSLWISKTAINSWDEIDQLDKWFPALTDIRLTGIPILEVSVVNPLNPDLLG
jgi:hypothetical protein